MTLGVAFVTAVGMKRLRYGFAVLNLAASLCFAHLPPSIVPPLLMSDDSVELVQSLMDNPKAFKAFRKLIRGNPINFISVAKIDVSTTEFVIEGEIFRKLKDDWKQGVGRLRIRRFMNLDANTGGVFVRYEAVEVSEHVR